MIIKWSHVCSKNLVLPELSLCIMTRILCTVYYVKFIGLLCTVCWPGLCTELWPCISSIGSVSESPEPRCYPWDVVLFSAVSLTNCSEASHRCFYKVVQPQQQGGGTLNFGLPSPAWEERQYLTLCWVVQAQEEVCLQTCDARFVTPATFSLLSIQGKRFGF